MSKEAELSYLGSIGEAGRQHSFLKPFSDEHCGINLLSIGTIIALLPNPPARILDLGCGGGWTSVFFALRGYNVVGQDIAPDMIELAIENRMRNGLSPENLDFVCGDYEAIAAADEFDCAVFFDSLHHSDDEALAIRSAYAALKPSGILVTHEPGLGHSTNPLSIQAMQEFGVNERDMPPSLIVKRGLEAGFTGYRILPMPGDLFHIFYQRTYSKSILSKVTIKTLRRLWKLLFNPDRNNSSIVILRK